MFFSLQTNPFERDFTFSFEDYEKYPFITNDSVINNLRFALVWNTSSNEPFFAKISSEKGSGKSTFLFYLQDELNKLDRENIRTSYIPYLNEDIVEVIRKIINLMNISGDGNIFEKLNKFSNTNKIYLFLDFQDSQSSKENIQALETFLIRFFKEFPKISIIISFNSNQEKEIEQTSIMGKFKQYTLNSFNLSSSNELIRLRLEKYRSEGFNGNPYYPFENILDLIYQYSGGNPRKIISLCSSILCSSSSQYTTSFPRQKFADLFKKSIISDILSEFTTDESLRQDLMILYSIILNNFPEGVNRQQELLDYVNKEKGWSYSTTIKRIKTLQKINLISINKSSENNWTRVIKVI